MYSKIATFCLLSFVLTFLNAQQGVLINEFMSSNSTSIVDYRGENSDWIELYNPNAETIDLNGYYLSDDSENLLKWSFDHTSIEPNGYLLIFASGLNTVFNQEIHANFRISKTGENLFLSDNNGQLVDSVGAISLETNESFGRVQVGDSVWLVHSNPSPNSNNIIPLTINCSHESGFYENEFNLVLSSFRPDMKLRYTTDGNPPTKDSKVYDEPINIETSLSESYSISKIPTTPFGEKWEEWMWKSPKNVDKAVVIQYALFKDKEQVTKTDSKIYFINNTSNYDMPVVSIITDQKNLFDYNTGIYIPGKEFDLENGEYHPNGNYRLRGQDWERGIQFTYFDKDQELVESTHAGMRMKGVGSTSYPQKSFNVFFRSEYGESRFSNRIYENDTVDDYKRITFRNSGQDFAGTHFKDAYLHELLKDLDLDIQRSRPSVVFINGEYWGIHNVRDKFDKHYFKSVYDIDENNINILNHCGYPDEGSNKDYFKLVDYIVENEDSHERFYDSIGKQIDLLNLIDYHISQLYYANFDWPCNNMKLWKTNDIGSKWRYLLYDLDFSYGESDDTSFDFFSLEHSTSNANGWPRCECSNLIFTKLLENDLFEKQFLDRFSYHLNNTFNIDRTTSLLEKYTEMYRPEMARHMDRWGYPANLIEWQFSINEMQSFAEKRACFMKSNLEDYFGIDNFSYECNDLESRNDQKNQLAIFPNPVSENMVTIEYKGYAKNSNYIVYDQIGQMIREGSVDSYPFELNINGLNQGVYVVKIDSGELFHTGKFVVSR